jgi:endonuclease/exonuclease/phosphatase (EEP) superfamily protein YafD
MRLLRQPWFGTAVAISSVLLLVTTVVGLGPRHWWLCDLFANLRLHAVIFAVTLVPVLLYLRRPKLGLMLALTVCVALTMTAGQVATPAANAAGASTRTLTIASFNLGPDVREVEAVARYLSGLDVDIVALQEYTHAWQQALAMLPQAFPHHVLEPRDGPFGIALFSRLPIADVAVPALTERQIPLIVATVNVAGQAVSVLALHLEWPMTPASFATRNKQIIAVQQVLRGSPLPAIVCGDWNLTPWSGWFREIRDSGLHAGDPTVLLAATWPASLRAAGIRIDHCLATADISLRSAAVGPAFGSDHLPIVVKAGIDHMRQ